MGGMAGVITLWVGGAADGSSVHFESLPAEPGAKFAWGRIRTFGSEQVDMVGGLGMVGGPGMVGGLGMEGGQLWEAARSGPAWVCSGSNLQYSTFRSLLQGMAGTDYAAEAGGQGSVASG